MDEVGRLRAEVEELRARMRVWGWAIGMGGAAVLAVVAASNLGAGSDTVDRLSAREIVLVDDAGTVRGRLSVNALGAASLTLGDSDGAERVWLEAADAHGTVRITDASERTLVRLSGVPGRTALHLGHAGGNETADLQVGDEGTLLLLSDLETAVTAQLRADAGGLGLQLARTPEGAPPALAVLTAGPGGDERGPALTLAGTGQFLEASVHPADAEPRLILAGERLLRSSTAAAGPAWSRTARPAPR